MVIKESLEPNCTQKDKDGGRAKREASILMEASPVT